MTRKRCHYVKWFPNFIKLHCPLMAAFTYRNGPNYWNGPVNYALGHSSCVFYPCFPEIPGTWISLNIHEYSSSVPGYNSSMDLNWNYSSLQTWINMNNHEYIFTGINMNYANTIKCSSLPWRFYIIFKTWIFFPTGFFFVSIYDKQVLLCITII